VAILFSPITQKELDDTYRPFPRRVFLMLQSNDRTSAIEQEMAGEVRTLLTDMRFQPFAATDLAGTADYLEKIVDMIRGCGFGVALYSDATEPRSLGNIFFEVGISHLLGKPVQLLLAGANPTPSDFVRTEWVKYDPARRAASLVSLRQAFIAIETQADYYYKLGEIAFDAEHIDFELAFERFKQAILIADHAPARAKLIELRDRLNVRQRGRPLNTDGAQFRRRLLSTMTYFLSLLPALPAPPL
jgi:hypothetical protein